MKPIQLTSAFSHAIRDNDEVHADRLINIATREGWDELADDMIIKYRETFGNRTEDEFELLQDELLLSFV